MGRLVPTSELAAGRIGRDGQRRRACGRLPTTTMSATEAQGSTEDRSDLGGCLPHQRLAGARLGGAFAPILAVLAALATGCDGGAASPTDGGAAEDAALVADGSRPRTRDAGPIPEDLDGFIAWHMAEAGIPGLAAGVVRGGELVWSKGYGFADVAAGRAVTSDTLFTLESITKPVAMTALMQLRDERGFSLDADIDRLMPLSVRNPRFMSTPITLRMLLAHTSSIEDDFLTLADLTYDGDPPISLREFVEVYLVPGGEHYAPTHFSEARPGSHYSYSNAAIGLAGYLVETLGEESFLDRQRRTVLTPLGMEHSGYRLADIDTDQLATPYAFSSRSGFEPQGHRGSAFFPANSLRSSVRDLSRFLRAFIAGGELDGERILAAASVAEMLEPADGTGGSRGLAWDRRSFRGMELIGHGGAGTGFTNYMYFRPDDGTGVILLTNSDVAVRAIFGLARGQELLAEIELRLYEEAPTL